MLLLVYGCHDILFKFGAKRWDNFNGDQERLHYSGSDFPDNTGCFKYPLILDGS